MAVTVGFEPIARPARRLTPILDPLVYEENRHFCSHLRTAPHNPSCTKMHHAEASTSPDPDESSLRLSVASSRNTSPYPHSMTRPAVARVKRQQCW